MWTWLDLPSGKLGVPHGLLRGADIEHFVDAETAVRRISADVDAIRAEARTEAEALVSEAQAQAQRILQDAESQAEALVVQGFEEGRMRGQAQALAEWHEKRLDLVLEQAAGLEGLQQTLARIVLTAVERVVRAEPSRGLFEKALARVGELVRETAGATLRVHPDDEAAALEALGATQGLRSPSARIEVLADASLPPGSCLFDSEQGSLDASIAVQLAALHAAVERACVRFAHEHEHADPEADEDTSR